MNVMNASDCASSGALLMSRFHQLSDGNSRRPEKSSLSVTAVDAGGVGEGVGAGDGAGVETGGGVDVLGLVGVGAASGDLLHETASRTRHPRHLNLNGNGRVPATRHLPLGQHAIDPR